MQECLLCGETFNTGDCPKCGSGFFNVIEAPAAPPPTEAGAPRPAAPEPLPPELLKILDEYPD